MTWENHYGGKLKPGHPLHTALTICALPSPISITPNIEASCFSGCEWHLLPGHAQGWTSSSYLTRAVSEDPEPRTRSRKMLGALAGVCTRSREKSQPGVSAGHGVPSASSMVKAAACKLRSLLLCSSLQPVQVPAIATTKSSFSFYVKNLFLFEQPNQ